MLLLFCNRLCFLSRVGFTRKFKGWRSYTKLSYFHKIGNEPLRALTVGQVFEATTKNYPDREAVVSLHQQQRLTYQDVLIQADKFAAGLRTLGLEKGDRIGIWAPNILEWIIIKIASARAGFVLVAINPAYQAKEMENCINKVGLKVLICPLKIAKYNFLETLNDFAPNLNFGKGSCANVPSLKFIILISEESIKGTCNYNEILNLADENCINRIKKNQHEVQIDDPLDILFTSGTTGQPKAAVLSHFQVVNNSFQSGIRKSLNNKHHKICLQVPLFHCIGLTIASMCAFNFGGSLVIPSATYNPVANLQALQDEKCSVIHGTPTMYIDLVNVQKKMKLDVNLQIAANGGAPCPPELFKQMKQFLNVQELTSVYGLTEATGVVFQSIPSIEDVDKSTSTVGCVGDHLEVKIVDKNNNIVPMGSPGELCVRGYCTMLGYWEDVKKTKEIKEPDNWLRTGDQFILQEDGYGKIVGRLKDLIIRGGENIYPKEIEDFLLTHPDILESSVVGLSHERLGEEVCACLRVKKGASVTQKSLEEFCKGKIAYFKIPSQVRVMDEFPKTLTGKIRKNVLRERFHGTNK